jgi:hypothetical protein
MVDRATRSNFYRFEDSNVDEGGLHLDKCELGGTCFCTSHILHGARQHVFEFASSSPRERGEADKADASESNAKHVQR